ncbi:MAG: glycoside hydrolase family 38 C-terminal domain-containing protein [Planctomycetota bacterium]
MLPRTPFDQFTAPRLSGLRDRMQTLIWHHAGDVDAIARTTPTAKHCNPDDAIALDYEPVGELPMTWDRKFDQMWWKVGIPGRARDGRHWMKWDDDAESTVYIAGGNGLVAHGAFDPGHIRCPIPEGCDAFYIEGCCLRTGIWVPGNNHGLTGKGSVFRGASVWTRDDDHFHAFHDLAVLIDTAAMLHEPPGKTVRGGNYRPDILDPGGYRAPVEQISPLFRQLMRRLDGAADVYEREGAAAFRKVMAEIYADFKAESWQIDATLTGHAHIDLVWLWPENVGEFKAVHTFANMLRMIDTYPEFVFGYTQPASYQAVERKAPEIIERVKQATAAGRWEPTGAMWVESDTQLPCGEALVRAVELGQKGLAKYRGGSESRVLWIPDVFGYSPCMPQILAGFGVPYFYTTKLHWSSGTQFPHSSFKWVGHDGSEVLTHISFNPYNNRSTPEEMKFFGETHRNSGVHPDTLVATGFGDGGGGTTEDMCERARRLGDLVTIPKTKWGTIEGFFDRMAEVADDLPSWYGEIYLEYHRGVQTTHGDLKHAYRRAERGLQVHEAVRCATGGGAIDDTPWERVCFAQFHDALPGSSIHEVYAEMVPELKSIADGHEQAGADELAGDGEACIFNPLPTEALAKVGDDIVKLPPLTGVTIASAERVGDEVTVNGMTIRNGRVSATLTEDGRVSALSVDGKPVAIAEPLGQLHYFRDLPARYPAWDIDRGTLSNAINVESAVEMKPTDNGLAFTRKVGDASNVTLTYALSPGGSVLEVTADIDWQDTDALLKIAFPTDYRGQDSRYGAPFGSAPRAQQPGGIKEDALFEVPGSRWAVVADDGERDGLMLITESKYGFGCHRRTLHLSLLRSAFVTNADHDRSIRDLPDGKAGTHSDIGRHSIRFAIGHYDANADRADQPAVLCDTLFARVIEYTGTPVNAGLLGIKGGPSLVATWARPTDDGFILRLNETLGRRGNAKLRLADGLDTEYVDLKGKTLGPCDGTITFKPYELISVRLRR